MNKYEEIKQLVEELDNDSKKAYIGNKAAGIRLRAGFQKLKALAQEGRAEITELKNKK